jgi:hypothetical protein
MKSLAICLLWFASLSVFAETVVINGVKAEVAASSTLKSKVPDAYSVKNLFDDNPATAWVEGASGAGKGEWVKIEFENEVRLDGIVFEPGYRKSFETFRENAFPSQIAIYLDNSKTSFDASFRYLQDSYIELGLFPFSKYNSNLTYLAILEGQKVKSILLKITASVEGAKYKDMAMSGITFITKGQSTFYQKLFEFDSTREQERIFWKYNYKKEDKCEPFIKANPRSDYKYNEFKKLLDAPSFYKQMFNGSPTYSLLPLPCKNDVMLVLGDPKVRIEIGIESDNIAYHEGTFYQLFPFFVYGDTDKHVRQNGILIDLGFIQDSADEEFPILPFAKIFE